MDSLTVIHMLELVASGLKGLSREVVFVGGATVALYVDESFSSKPRPTDDVDCTVEITSRQEYYELEKEIRKLGFKHKAGGGPICRWTYLGITVDIIPSEGKVLGFKNSWYPAGIAHAVKTTLPNKTEISIFTLPYFLASKLEAFRDRGKNEPRTSSDFEDIIFILDGCRKVEEKLSAAPSDVRNFLAAEFKRLSSSTNFAEGITANLDNDSTRAERSRRIIDILKKI